MRVVYEIDMDIELSDNTDLISIMDNLAEAIERARREGIITDSNDIETVIGNIYLRYDEENQPNY